MRAHTHLSVVAGLCVAGTLAAAVLVSPPQVQPPPTVAHRVQLAAAPALGAIPLAFIRNQFQYCSLICPYAVQGAITVPIGGVQAADDVPGLARVDGLAVQGYRRCRRIGDRPGERRDDTA